MRIIRLDLTAFGPFTDLSLPLGEPGVHVVYGPNEAGKSTALESLNQLFYGIDVRSRYGFVHDITALRLGATIVDDSGNVLEFVRHKRRKDDLTDPDGTPIDADRLLGFLHGITRDVFTSTFALTLTELQRGGESLLKGEGDVGQALFSAQSSQDLSAVLDRLEERRRALFLATGQKPSINEALGRYRALDRKMRDKQTPATEFARLRAAADAAKERFDELDSRLQRARAEQHRLEQLALAVPLLRRRAQDRAHVEALRDQGPFAAADATDRLHELEQRAALARQRRRRAAEDLASQEAELAALHVDERLVGVAKTVAALVKSAEKADGADRDLAALSREESDQRARAARLLRETRPRASVDDPASFTVAAADAERVSALAREHPALVARAESAREQSLAKSADADAARAGVEALAEAADGGLLETVLSEFPSGLTTDLPRAHADLVDTDARLASLLAEAGWAGADPETLLKADVPSRAEIKAHARRVDEHRAARRELRAAHASAGAELDRHRAGLEALRASGDPPTAADLAAARAERDERWRTVRSGRASPPDLDAYASAVDAADALADRLYHQAKQVAERVELEKRVREAALELDRLDGELADSDRVRVDLDRAWDALWPPDVLPAPSLDAAETVLDRLDRLRDLHRERTARGAELERLSETADTLIDQLTALLTDAGADLGPLAVRSGAGVGRGVALLPQLRCLAESELHQRREAAEARAAALLRAESAERDRERARADEAAAEAALAAWERRWAAAAEPAGFDASAAPTAVLSDLDRLSDVADLLERARTAGQRAREVRAEVASFEERLTAVFDECGLELPADRAERAVALDTLDQRVRASAAAAQRHAELVEDIRDRAESLREARAEEESADEAVSALLTEAGVPDTAGLRAASERAAEAASLRQRILDAEDQLAQYGPISELEERADGYTDHELAARAAEVSEEVDRLDRERIEQNEEWTAARVALERIDGSAEAAAASDELSAVRAEIAEHSEEYVRLTIARELLLRCVEAYRQENQDPILRRAEAFFQTLTLGRFTGLRPDLDGGRNVLRVLRPTGVYQDVPTLSEGTRDQLYLALRLASLERYAASGQSMPFVVDDIFMTFDDERTRAGLRVLDALAAQFQVVVFTHHRHIADLASAALPPGRAHIHRLPRFDPPSPAAARPPEAAAPPPPRPLECRDCGAAFTHTGRGRRPVRCPGCRGTA